MAGTGVYCVLKCVPPIVTKKNNLNADCYKENTRTADCHTKNVLQIAKRLFLLWQNPVHLRVVCKGVIPVMANRSIRAGFATKE
jgi:hypothetical protein